MTSIDYGPLRIRQDRRQPFRVQAWNFLCWTEALRDAIRGAAYVDDITYESRSQYLGLRYRSFARLRRAPPAEPAPSFSACTSTAVPDCTWTPARMMSTNDSANAGKVRRR